MTAEPTTADVLHHIVPTPRPPADCDCESCDDQRHLEAERQTWRDEDDARRTAAELRQQGEGR